MTRPLVVMGDALFDRDVAGRAERLCPEAPVPVVDVDADGERARPGGAGLAALLAAGEGRPVVLVTALGDDDAGAAVAHLLASAGVEIVDLGLTGPTPEKTRILADGRLVARVDRGGGGSGYGPWTPAAADALASAAAVLVSDYGRGMAAHADARRALGGLPPQVAVVWDPHPRGPVPVPGSRMATPNRPEAAGFVPDVGGEGLAADAARARVLADRWAAAAVAVTRGSEGAVLWSGDGPPLAVPSSVTARDDTEGPGTGGGRAPAPDACGAGDRFASAAAGALADGALPSEAVTHAVAAACTYVAAGGAAGVGLEGNGAVPGPQPSAPWARLAHAPPGRTSPPPDATALARRIRARRGTVVAAGGCFDLLHAGHVRMLEAARALGDCLIVCLNSDASVRRLKGPGRPVVPADDRVSILLGLACVDAVTVFDEDTPQAALERLQPHLWVKGADYRAGDLPEAEALARWGGQAVVVPFLEGRSTSTLVGSLARPSDHPAHP